MKTYFHLSAVRYATNLFFFSVIQMLTFESNNCRSTFVHINETPSSSTSPFLRHKGTVITELILAQTKMNKYVSPKLSVSQSS